MIKSDNLIILLNTILLIFFIEVTFFFVLKITNHHYFMNNSEFLNTVKNKSEINFNDLSSDKTKIAIFGGSSSAGYGSILSFEQILNNYFLGDVIIHNYAENGSSFYGFQNELMKIILPYYDNFIIYSGHNEIWSQIFNENYKTIPILNHPDGSSIDLKGYVISQEKELTNIKKKINKNYDNERNYNFINKIKNYSRLLFFSSRTLKKIKIQFKKIGKVNNDEVFKLKLYDKNKFLELINKDRMISNYKLAINEIIPLLRKDQKLYISNVISNNLFPPIQSKSPENIKNIKKIEDKLFKIYQKLDINNYKLNEETYTNIYQNELRFFQEDAHLNYLKLLECLQIHKKINKCNLFLEKVSMYDDIPYRVLPEINTFITSLSNKYSNVFVANPSLTIKNYSTVDYLDFFIDFQHPSAKGNILIAEGLLELMGEENFQIKLKDCNTYQIEKKGLIRKIRIHQDYFNDQININLNFLKGGIETYKSNFMYKFYLNKAHNKLSTCNY